MNKTEELTYQIIAPLIADKGYDLVDVVFQKEGSEWFLRIFIDRLDGVSVDLNDCELVSRLISDHLDREDPIEQAYRLEVSSPGIERVLKTAKDFTRFHGALVKVMTYMPVAGQKAFVGHLQDVDDHLVVLDIAGKEQKIERDKVSKINLHIDF